jgi:Ser/Thr protein kinase RdoA (MazF antagonist)
MDQRIRDRYNDTILQQAMQRYGIANGQIRPLDAFESFIYTFERGERAYILRIGHTFRKSEALIRGEVDWINYLAAGGVSAAKAILSETGQLVETVDDGQGGQFLVTAFEHAPGQPPWELWTPTLYETYGRLLGSMHMLAEQYQPADIAWKRPEWDEALFELVERYLPASESAACARYQELLAHLHTLPKTPTTYGLIHQDAHGSNFFVDNAGRITLFDFDDCAYSWFGNDIAIVLFYIVQDADDPPTFTRDFMTHFLRGYREAHPFDRMWLKEIPHFLKLREIELYAVIHRDFDVTAIDHEWCARFMRDRKYKIEHDLPFIAFDFESLATDA